MPAAQHELTNSREEDGDGLNEKCNPAGTLRSDTIGLRLF